MRDLILKMSISIDGFVGDLDGRNAWMFGTDGQAKAWSVAMLWEAGLHIMGSRTFLAMAAHWPTATDMFAAPMNAIPKAVFSRQGAAIVPPVPNPDVAKGSWTNPHVAGGDLGAEIAALKAEGGKPIVAHGGAGFARSMIAQGLVDRFVLLTMPVALGRGLPLFADLVAPMPLVPVSSTSFPGGAVARIYRPA